MAKNRVPKVGDQVEALGHHGAFVVTEIHTEHQTANLTKIGAPDFTLIVGWDRLGFLDELDTGQIAARIVREATEGR